MRSDICDVICVFYFVHDTRFSFPFYEKIRPPVRRSENWLIHHFSRLLFFHFYHHLTMWMGLGIFLPILKSFDADSWCFISQWLDHFEISRTKSKTNYCSSRTNVLDESDPTFTSAKKIEIVIWKKISVKLSPSILSLLLLMPFSFMFNLWRT